MGWRVLTIWECEVDALDFNNRIDRFLRHAERQIDHDHSQFASIRNTDAHPPVGRNAGESRATTSGIVPSIAMDSSERSSFSKFPLS